MWRYIFTCLSVHFYLYCDDKIVALVLCKCLCPMHALYITYVKIWVYFHIKDLPFLMRKIFIVYYKSYCQFSVSTFRKQNNFVDFCGDLDHMTTLMFSASTWFDWSCMYLYSLKSFKTKNESFNLTQITSMCVIYMWCTFNVNMINMVKSFQI